MMKLDFDETTLGFRVTFEQTSWETATGFRPSITVGETVIYFDEAVSVEHSYTPRAVRSSYTFTDYCFETKIRLEGEDEVFFEWRPIKEVRAIDRVVWPGPLAFEEASNDWVSLLPIQQGLLIPNTWPEALGPISFDGLFLTAGATMPWFSQLKGDQAVLASCLTPWDDRTLSPIRRGGAEVFDPGGKGRAVERARRVDRFDGRPYRDQNAYRARITDV